MSLRKAVYYSCANDMISFQAHIHLSSMYVSGPLWISRGQIETRGVLAMAQAFTTFGAYAKLLLVWLRC